MRQMTNPLLRIGRGLAFAPFCACLLLATPASAESERVDFGGGSVARIHSADELLDSSVTLDGERAWLSIPGLPSEELTLPSPGAAEFRPHAVENVRALLSALGYPGDLGEVEIFLLPYPRARVSASSTIGRRVFLSPGSAEPAALTTHMLLAHELGHLFHVANLGEDESAEWQLYRRLRRITDDSVYHSEAEHRFRPREILAEDFRYLFGGALANYSGSIENADLPLPDAVPGLLGFFLAPPGSASFGPDAPLASANFPNPFNPDTRIFLSAGDARPGEALRVQVLDASGRLCRRLYDGELTGRSMEFQWDGRDERGRPLGSGVYFADLRLGERRLAHKMILAK